MSHSPRRSIELLEAVDDTTNGRTTKSFIPKRREHMVESGGRWEGVDFDTQESTVWLMSRKKLSDAEYRHRFIFAWSNVFITAILTTCVALAIDYVLKNLAYVKWNVVLIPITMKDDSKWRLILTFIGFNVGFVAIASGMVCLFERVAAGSGIPEIKCILNGNRQNHALGLKTLLVKATGVLFSVAGSLPVGKEGPMIHCGAIIGSGIGSGMSSSLNFRAKLNKQFRNFLDRRDQVGAGAAAGVAAAFGAPIGGVLFAIEEGASYWNQTMTWRTFFGTMCGALFLNVVLNVMDGNPILSDGHFVVDRVDVIEFGNFGGVEQTRWVLMELPLIIILGVICGLLGALFNEMQKRLSMWRQKHVPATSDAKRFFEALFVAAVVSVCGAGIPFLFPLSMVCKSINAAMIPQPDGTLGLHPRLKGNMLQFYCKDGEFNEVATLFFQLSEKAILNLFHNGNTFNLLSLFAFGVVYFLLAMFTYGIAVPSGLFVPCLTIGAAFGRFYGQIMRMMFPYLGVTNIGFYALLGAGGMLGGVARLTISATVILLEATQNVSYTLPVMICTMVAKKVGDQFNHGLYDIHIFLKKVPLLEEHPPIHSEKLQVQDILTRSLAAVPEIVTVREAQMVLLETTHGSFPVVSDSGRFSGLITRDRLVSLLALKAWSRDKPAEIVGRQYDVAPGKRENLVTQEQLDHFFPRFPAIESIPIADVEKDYWMDLTPYMNPGAYTVSETTPLSRAFRLFRGLGLRYVPVLNDQHCPVGVITRKCLMEDAIEKALHESESKRKERLGSVAGEHNDIILELQREEQERERRKAASMAVVDKERRKATDVEMTTHDDDNDNENVVVDLHNNVVDADSIDDDDNPKIDIHIEQQQIEKKRHEEENDNNIEENDTHQHED